MKKSNHKHLYEEVLIEDPNGERFDKEKGFIKTTTFYRAHRCMICGKEKRISFFESIRIVEDGVERYKLVIKGDEIKSLYPNLPVFLKGA